MGVFVADVRPRWSDMDAFGHVNHASTVTLLEEARVALLFGEAARYGVEGMARGMVVARLTVDYVAPLVVDGGCVRIELSVRELRAASFTMHHTVRAGRDSAAAVVATAETLLVPYSVKRGKPRRLTDAERDFLAGWHARTADV
ncbi:MAG: acyl-CoA thioesterase [Sciscionella sp.]